ncbi:MAG: ROK family protein [Rhodothermales bacterium]
MSDAEYVIGFDVGGTRMKSGAVTLHGELSEPVTRPSGFSIEPETLLKAIIAEVDRISGVLGRRPAAIGLGFPGGVDPEFGSVLLPGKLKVEGFPIVPRLRDATSIPVIADNDGRLSILAEARYGLARDEKWAVTITLGTGVGSGVLLDGKVLRDPHLLFGTQASHIVQEATNDRLDITRARGTANLLCSATTLAMMVRDSLQRGLPSVLNEAYFEDPHAIDFEAVIRGVEQEDALCVDALERWTKNLGWFLVSVVHMYAPELIVLGGGASNAADHFLPAVQRYVDDHIFRHPKGSSVPIAVSELGSHSGVLGAGVLAWEHVGKGSLLG